ncbi:Adaptive-response sensory-kinase SasA [Paraburkholderia nemoris]|uniref:PAS domain-containing sensor histidine kinase n=1 Tax=Paraburkholderia nemoris TaxID=2793076 RepID=UPI00190C109F|nr:MULTISPECIES: ATP-binding protein [Paraburkholderia]MBK3787061.1 PAS domain S-box protein [Paraburkholderia aspalathi]CAE6868442.1 Adaptive-response sensory-kinase SasA [Paraburkholderia nemoris]
MNIVMPAVVVLGTATLLRLLTLWSRRQRHATPASPHRDAGPRVSLIRQRGPGPGVGWARIVTMLCRSIRRSVVVAPVCPAPHMKPPLTGKLPMIARLRIGWRMAVPPLRTHETGEGVTHRSASAIAAEPGRSEYRLRETVEWFPLAILVLDPQGRIVVANTQTTRLFGYAREELAGTTVDLLVPELRCDHSDACQNAFRSVSVMSGGNVACDTFAKRRDGVEFPVEIACRTLLFEGDAAMMVSMVDRTDRQELNRNRQELAHLARVSTMGELAASLAHELNQPLTAILSNAQAAQRFLAADPVDLAEVREILNDIVQDDCRASEVIRRVRAVVRKGEMEIAPLDLASVIRDVLLLVHSDAIVRAIGVTLDIDGDLPAVRGDKVQLQQVMLNLLLNAFDAMNNAPPGDRAVSVTLRAYGNNRVHIAVRDGGHGLTVDRLDRIFKPFFTSKPQGLGLGLSISRSIVDMHGGQLWAENNTDRGATFHVMLPAGDAG